MLDRIVLLGAETPSGRAVAKKLRTEQFCCMLAGSSARVEDILALDPAGIVIAGEEREGAAPPDAGLLSLGLPVLAFGSAARSLLCGVGRSSQIHSVTDAVLSVEYRGSRLFSGVEPSERWMERADYYEVDAPYRVIAEAEGLPLAFADEERSIFLLQFSIERNDPEGMQMLRAFAQDICGCTPWWTLEEILESAKRMIAETVGDGEAICAMSGGLDSTVAAVLAQQAIGARARCVFVDTGLLREGEAAETERMLSQELGLALSRVDASARVLRALAGLDRMCDKWLVVEREITLALAEEVRSAPEATVFIKGTNYSDLIGEDSARRHGDGPVRVVEPLGMLFKEEIRALGEVLNISPRLLGRQPFPGMGLAARIRGEVTAERLVLLRRADAILMEEITASGQERRLERYFAMYYEVGDFRVVILRVLQGSEPTMSVARLPYDLLERTVERIGREVHSVNRVLYDITPGMAEWPM